MASLPVAVSASTSAPQLRNRRQQDNRDKYAILLLALAIFWPVLLPFFSSTKITTPNAEDLRTGFKSLLERYELVGYGPTHPRVAFVLVATKHLENPLDAMTDSISSILQHTDRNRIFTICAAFEEGVVPTSSQDSIQAHFDKLDGGTSTHWHGLIKHDAHDHEQTDHDHGDKIRALFMESEGVGSTRREAADFVKILEKKHEDSGLKSAAEDILLVFMRPDSKFKNKEWLDIVTGALIIPQNIDESSVVHESNANLDSSQPLVHAQKLANAVSFAVGSEVGAIKTINESMQSLPSTASAQDMAMSNGDSYPTPVVEGSITAMRLDTFVNLPARDDSMDTHFAADLELSLNLWLCADGVDIIPTLRAKTTDGLISTKDSDDTSETSAVRLIAAWMKGKLGDQMLAKYIASKGLEKRIVLDEVRKAATTKSFPVNLDRKCRPFDWYATQILQMDTTPKVQPKTVEKKKEEAPMKKESNAVSETNKEIISRTHPIDLEYVDVTNGFEDHPHMGARDENGNYGYVFDETALRKNPPEFKVVNKEAVCKQDGNKRMLTEKVFIDMAAHEAAERAAESGHKPRAKIFCVVYTIEKNHERIPFIHQTWGQKCDGFMVASDKTDKEVGTVDIAHEGVEDYHNIWQKVRSIWSYIYDNYYEKYDWFHIGGDDLYVLVENLRLYLESEEIQVAANGGKYLPTGDETSQTPLFLGRRFKEQGNEDRIFNSGGSGYSINKAALKALVVDAFPTCQPHLKTFAEDVMVAQCLRNKIKVFPYDTKDENGGERYMPFQPAHHLTYRMPADKSSDWYATYSIDVKEGLDHCAARSVAFHYIKSDLMKKMHAILYGHCN